MADQPLCLLRHGPNVAQVKREAAAEDTGMWLRHG